MASAMPVLPEVGSISVSPGLIVPRFSAWRIMEIAGRSLTEPAGLLPSSLARITFLSPPGSRCRRTSGVLPMKSSTVFFIAASSSLLEMGHVGGDALLHVLELALVAGGTQLRQVGLGVALVLVHQAGGE